MVPAAGFGGGGGVLVPAAGLGGGGGGVLPVAGFGGGDLASVLGALSAFFPYYFAGGFLPSFGASLAPSFGLFASFGALLASFPSLAAPLPSFGALLASFLPSAAGLPSVLAPSAGFAYPGLTYPAG